MTAGLLLAEYDTPEALLAAARRMRELGYHRLEAYTPYPVSGAEDALGLRPSRLPYIALGAGLTGASGAYLLQWWMTTISYPLNVGGRPPHNPLAFVPITFEMAVLFAAFASFITVLVKADLPRLWHPVHEVPGFERASIDRFWLSVDGRDHNFERARTAAELAETGSLRVAFTGKNA